MVHIRKSCAFAMGVLVLEPGSAQKKSVQSSHLLLLDAQRMDRSTIPATTLSVLSSVLFPVVGPRPVAVALQVSSARDAVTDPRNGMFHLHCCLSVTYLILAYLFLIWLMMLLQLWHLQLWAVQCKLHFYVYIKQAMGVEIHRCVCSPNVAPDNGLEFQASLASKSGPKSSKSILE